MVTLEVVHALLKETRRAVEESKSLISSSEAILRRSKHHLSSDKLMIRDVIEGQNEAPAAHRIAAKEADAG